MVQEIELGKTAEGERGQHFEADSPKPEVKENSDVGNEEAGIDFETEAEPHEEKCDRTGDPCAENMIMPLNLDDEVHESDGVFP